MAILLESLESGLSLKALLSWHVCYMQGAGDLWSALRCHACGRLLTAGVPLTQGSLPACKC